MGRAALLAVFGLLVTAPVAVAAPPWSTPESVSSPTLFVSDPRVVFDSSGRAYATWRFSETWHVAVREPNAAEFGPERSAPNLVTPLFAHGFDRVLGLDQRARGRRLVSLRARVGRPDGSFGRPDTISTYEQANGYPSLAVFDRALVAWAQQGARGRRIVRAAIRRGRAGFGRPVTLSGRGRAREFVAAASAGVLFVAWERAGRIEARVRRIGRGWGPVRRIGPASRGSTTFRAAFSGRRGYLAWLARTNESEVLRVAVLPTARTRFRAPQTIATIERDPLTEAHGPVLVPIRERDALLAWTGWDGAAWRVRAAETGPGARFGAPIDVSPPGEQAVLGDAGAVPASSEGVAVPHTVVVVWSRLDAVREVGDRIRAAVRLPGGTFGPPEDVSDLDRARLPDLAFDHRLHRWTAVWSQRMGPDQGVPQSQITTFLRFATRPG